MVNELDARGWDVTLIVLNRHRAVLQKRFRGSVKIVDLEVPHARQAILRIARRLREDRPNLILTFNHQLAVILVVVRWLAGVEFELVARNISVLSEKARYQRSWWHRYIVSGVTWLLYRRVDRIIVQSVGMQEDLITHFGVDARKVYFVPNPLAPQFTEAYEPRSWRHRPEEILYVGRLERIKGLDLLASAVSLALPQNEKACLRIVGDGPMFLELKAQLVRTGFGDRVRFEGFVENTRTYYRNAKILILTSFYEGFPNVLIEAMSQGTPVVSVDCRSGPREVIEEGVNGLLVPGRSPSSFAEAISRALSREWDAARIRRSVKKFAPGGVVDQYERILTDSRRERR